MSTVTLDIEKKKTLVPELRFQEFEGEWKNCLLNDLTKYVKGFAFKSEDYQENGVRIVRVSDLSSDRIKNDNEKVYINESKSKLYDKYKLKSGNIIITTVGSKPEMIESAVGRGILIQNDNEGLLNQNMLKFENIKNVDNRYIIGLINTKRYQHYMKSIARGNANQANITVVDLLQYQVSIPIFPEQQKIASFLSAVDEKIQQLSRKKELLEQYKKGVMQQLFSGKLRFKDENGRDYADWEEKKLGDLVTLMQSGISRMLSDTDIGLPIIRSNNLQNGRIDITDIKYWFEIDDQGANLENYVLCEGDLLVNFINSIAQIGKVAIFSDLLKRKTIFTTNLMRLRFNYKVTSRFMINYFNLKKYNDFIQSITKPAVNQASFTTKDFRTFIVDLPSLPEQQKTANFLTSIDAKIESVNQQINQTQTFKKGLLQQMFV
ncbi:restriction endonuclease subunit S [Flavobacterium sp. GT2N3]|uniref:restriction endonuclease subunit S n=1 Tax=unclassified Flavobacterium TaxID=196869 RepID=UPI003AAB4304